MDADDIDIALADTQTVTQTNPAPAPAQTRFDAATRCGAMSLYVDGAPAAHAAEAALRLDRCDSLLDALDAWLHAALDWRWLDTVGVDETARPRAAAHCTIDATESSAPLACRLEVPWPLLRALGAPTDALAKRLHWSAAPGLLVVSQPAVDEAELRLLERGGAIVLPESMRTPWQGRLRAPQELLGDGITVELADADTARLASPGAAEPAVVADSGRPFCEVRMTTARPLTPVELAGWAAGSTVDLAPRVSLWRCGGLTDTERFLAGGRLLPWGDGWAMLIESL